MTQTETRAPVDKAAVRRELIAGLALFLAAAIACYDVFNIRSKVGFDVTGPRFFPMVVCGAWLVLSAIYIVQTALRCIPLPADDRHEDDADLGPGRLTEPALLLGLLVVYVFVLVPLGYILSTALFFIAAARILGSRNWARDITVAIGLSVVVYLVFSKLLSIILPEGVLPL